MSKKEPNERLVRILARKYATPHTYEDDLFQEGMLAIIKAEQSFRADMGIKFETYASRVISNRFIDILRRQKEHTDKLIEDQQSGSFSLDDEINIIEIKKILREKTTELERAIFNSYVAGFSYEEIGKIFELPRKKIDNTVQKVKRKIKENI